MHCIIFFIEYGYTNFFVSCCCCQHITPLLTPLSSFTVVKMLLRLIIKIIAVLRHNMLTQGIQFCNC